MRILARAVTAGGMYMHMKKIFYAPSPTSWLCDVHIARVSPIKVHLLKINQYKRIRMTYHIL